MAVGMTMMPVRRPRRMSSKTASRRTTLSPSPAAAADTTTASSSPRRSRFPSRPSTLRRTLAAEVIARSPDLGGAVTLAADQQLALEPADDPVVGMLAGEVDGADVSTTRDGPSTPPDAARVCEDAGVVLGERQLDRSALDADLGGGVGQRAGGPDPGCAGRSLGAQLGGASQHLARLVGSEPAAHRQIAPHALHPAVRHGWITARSVARVLVHHLDVGRRRDRLRHRSRRRRHHRGRHAGGRRRHRRRGRRCSLGR